MRCPHENTATKYEFAKPPDTAVTVITYCKTCGAVIVRHTYKSNAKTQPCPLHSMLKEGSGTE